MIDTGGSGLDASTIGDAAPEFTLGGAAAAGVTVQGIPTLVGGGIYRYSFTGSFSEGPVSVTFPADAFADAAGTGNALASFSFTTLRLVSVGNVAVKEGNSGTTKAVFPVTLSSAGSTTVSVSYAAIAGTATAKSDFTAATGTVTFKPGETKKTITISVAGDKLYENDETFTVKLSSPVNVALGIDSATGTILNDDLPPTLSVADVAVKEGNAGTTTALFTLKLSAASGLPATVNYATADGTAIAGIDYQAASGSVTFAPGQTSKTVSVLVIGDTLDEPDETFRLALSSPAAASSAGRLPWGRSATTIPRRRSPLAT